MHEASLMAALMRQIPAVADVEQGRRVTCVSVWLGALSHFSVEHFTEHFRHASDGTLAEGAELKVRISDDTQDAHAQNVVLESIEVEV